MRPIQREVLAESLSASIFGDLRFDRIDVAMIDEVAANSFDPARADATYLVAGRSDMVAAARNALAELGVPDARIFSEDHA
jgi:ferredoxin-NADP reductase